MCARVTVLLKLHERARQSRRWFRRSVPIREKSYELLVFLSLSRGADDEKGQLRVSRGETLLLSVVRVLREVPWVRCVAKFLIVVCVLETYAATVIKFCGKFIFGLRL